MLLGRLLRPVVSPRFKCLGAGLPGLLGSCFWSYCLRQVQVVAAPAVPPVSLHPAPAWFSSKTSASWVLTVASAPDSERAFAFGRSLCSVSSSASSPSTLVASWCGS